MSKAEQQPGQGGLFDYLFDPPQPDPIWGYDRIIAKERAAVSAKPYGRQDRPTHSVPVVLDWSQAKEAMKAAIDQADRNADPTWKRIYYDALCYVATRQPEFDADDIWQRMNELPNVPEQHERRAAGGVVLRAVRNRVIDLIPNYFKPSRRKNCHGTPIQVYRSLVVGRPLSEIPQYE